MMAVLAVEKRTHNSSGMNDGEDHSGVRPAQAAARLAPTENIAMEKPP
jgi:hypothetical protein